MRNISQGVSSREAYFTKNILSGEKRTSTAHNITNKRRIKNNKTIKQIITRPKTYQKSPSVFDKSYRYSVC